MRGLDFFMFCVEGAEYVSYGYLDEYQVNKYPGESIKGTLYLDASKKLKNINCVTIALLGKCKVCWPEEDSDSSVKEESYVEKYQKMYTGGDIDRGKHEYPFSFRLPKHIPSSFECKDRSISGYVRYTLEATLERGDGLPSNETTVMTIIVQSRMNLNHIRESKNPVTASESEIFTTCCSTVGPVTVDLSIPRKGYTPGDTIPVTAKIKSEGNISIKKTKIKLIQRVILTDNSYLNGQTRKIETTIECAKQRKIKKVKSGENGSWKAVNGFIPPSTPATNLGGFCTFIDVSYALQFHVHVNGVMVCELPIIIGDVPLKDKK